MLPAPRASLAANTSEFETFPLVKPTGFREYDARWWFGIPGNPKAPELNLLGVQALGLGLGTLIHEFGVAPKIVTVVGEAIQEIHRRGVSVILIEQKLTIAMKISTGVCLLGHGQIVFSGTPDELGENPQLLKDWLAV